MEGTKSVCDFVPSDISLKLLLNKVNLLVNLIDVFIGSSRRCEIFCCQKRTFVSLKVGGALSW